MQKYKLKSCHVSTILLGVGGTCYNEHALNQFKQLVLDHQRAIEVARTLHARSVTYANKLVTTRHAIENDKYFSRSGSGASLVLEYTHGSSEPMCLLFLN
eukprot:1154885-Pelagomonas_calceolata.AAC.1